MAEDCHCCSQRASIFCFALVEMVAGHLGLSWGTQFLAQDSLVVARGAGSDAGGVGGLEMSGFYQFLGALVRLGCVLVGQMNCLTFEMPSPVTLSTPESADLNQNLACLLSRCRGRGATPTSA